MRGCTQGVRGGGPLLLLHRAQLLLLRGRIRHPSSPLHYTALTHTRPLHRCRPSHTAAAAAGTLDQGVGTLEVFEPEAADGLFGGTLDTFASLTRVVDSLAGRTAKLTAAA